MRVCVSCIGILYYTSITPARSTRYRVSRGPRSLTTIIIIIIVFGSQRVARLCACRISGVVLHVAPHNARFCVPHIPTDYYFVYSISRLARVHHYAHTHTFTRTTDFIEEISTLKHQQVSWRGFFYHVNFDETFFEYLQW